MPRDERTSKCLEVEATIQRAGVFSSAGVNWWSPFAFRWGCADFQQLWIVSRHP